MKRLVCVLLSLILVLSLSGCQREPIVSDVYQGPFVYYINSSYTSLISEPFVPATGDDFIYEDYLLALENVPMGEAYVAPLSGISVVSTSLKEGRLTLELGREYEALKGTKEVMVRAAIVKTLTQDENVSEVEINVGGNPITNEIGEVIGVMDAGRFVDYFGKEQDALLSENLTIYYASEDGNNLIREIHRVYYENTLTLEQAVIKCLKDSPESRNAQNAISPSINIINLSNTDGVCYLDMDMSFFDINSNVNINVALMSIVNSLCELDGVRHVTVNIIDDENSGGENMQLNLSGTYDKDTTLVLN